MPGGSAELGGDSQFQARLESQNREPEVDEAEHPAMGDDLDSPTLEGRPTVPEQSEEVAEIPSSEKPIPFEKLEPELQAQLLDRLLEDMRKVLRPVEDYAVFASTAMYLNGEKLLHAGVADGAMLMKPPGDFDAALWREADLDRIRERLADLPDVLFAKVDRDGKYVRDAEGEIIFEDHPGPYGKFPGQDLKILAGKRLYEVDVNGKSETIAYDFEFFLNSRLVQRELAEGNTTEAHGLKILNLDGLQRQYQGNWDFEARVNADVTKAMQALTPQTPEQKLELANIKAELASLASEREDEADDVVVTEPTARLLAQLDLHPRELQRVFAIQQKIGELEQELTLPFEKLSHAGLMEKLAEAQATLGNTDRAARLKSAYEQTQSLVSERATLLAGTKTKLWKRDLNLLQLAKLRGLA